MEDYIKILLEQIRCKKACPRIEQEVRSHIEDQVEANRTEWMMDEEEAKRCALRDMGDPIEAGVALDRIHRPQIAWDLVAVMAVVGIISILIHVIIGFGAEEINYQTGADYIFHAVSYVVIGFLAMLLIYRLDYSILAKRGKICAFVFLAVLTVAILFLGTSLNGRMGFLQIGSMRISLVYLMFLYVPVYGAVLYQYRNSGWSGILRTICFLIYPVWLAWRMPCISLAGLLLFIISVMLSAAVWKGWFKISKKVFFTAYWGVLALMPIMLSFLLVSSARAIPKYQQKRVMSFFSGEYKEYDYVTQILMEHLKSSRLFGAGSASIADSLPDYYSDYILTFLSSYYGIAAAFGICLLVGIIAMKAFRIAFSQRNQLGMMIGFGSGLVLAANTVLNIGENMGMLPRTATFLPFFSYTGTGIVVSYILTGIVLSVYRYKNILPADRKETSSKQLLMPVGK